jgi:cellulose synthase/poly-beta-1,6-N-acetylglucosamine synthase-like glycosyltransferase
MCLNGNLSKGPNQPPFAGADYDYSMWIDSDMVFAPEQFERLLSHDKNIVSGMYKMANGKQFATVEKWNEDFFIKYGHFYFMVEPDRRLKPMLFSVSYTGFGFILVKKGVFEAMKYPWFKPIFKKIGEANEFVMEDVAFCLTAEELGYKVWVDPTVVVGHEKMVVL